MGIALRAGPDQNIAADRIDIPADIGVDGRVGVGIHIQPVAGNDTARGDQIFGVVGSVDRIGFNGQVRAAGDVALQAGFHRTVGDSIRQDSAHGQAADDDAIPLGIGHVAGVAGQVERPAGTERCG